jgi:hypothetical protein
MKIALLIYGQPRFLSNPRSHSSHKKHLFDKHEVDVFTHYWLPSDEKTFEYSSWITNIKSNILEKNIPKKIEDLYNPLFSERDCKICFENDHLELKKYIKEYFNDPFYININNLFSHLWSFEKTIEIFNNNKNVDYDFFVISRYDNYIEMIPDFETLKKKKWYCSNHHNRFPDLMYIGDPILLENYKPYSKMSDNLCSLDIWTPEAEYFKYKELIRNQNINVVTPIKMTSWIVRNQQGEY